MPSAKQRVLAVSQQGGHLVELIELMPRIADAEVDWVTFDTAQSRSLLADHRVHFVDPVMPRDARALLGNIGPALRILRGGGYSLVVGSGAISLAFLPAARAMGMDAIFIECATRMDGPSVTGRMLAVLPGIQPYVQTPLWAGGRWRYGGSVFENFEGGEPRPARPIEKVVVTFGLNPYPFRSALDRLVEIIPPGVEVLWQVGHTDASDLPIEAHESLPSHVLDEAMRDADVVIAHAGTGSSLQALEAGRIPLLVPRRAARGEQVDEHQPELARDLTMRGLALSAEVEDLSYDQIVSAAVLTARRRPAPPPFDLG